MFVHELGEFELIERIISFFEPPFDVRVGVGDDAAGIRLRQKISLVTVDSFVEGVHFRKEWGFLDRFGKKALVGSTSDIAAMGGIPRYFLMAVVVPENLLIDELDSFMYGVSQKAKELDIFLIGGNISRGCVFEVHFTVIGEAQRVITRSGASPNEPIFVTGSLGGSWVGERILECKEIEPVDEIKRKLIERFIEPQGRIPEAQKIASTGLVTSMIDISDGLLSDLAHILEKSGLGASIFKEELPIFDGVVEFAKRNKLDPFDIALASGEEYELLFTVKSDKEDEFLDKAKKLSVPLKKIGYTRIERGITGVDVKNIKGFRHF